MSKLQLRRCRSCPKTAENEEELELFCKDTRLPYGRRNECKECNNKYKKQQRKNSLDLIAALTGLECSWCGFSHNSTAPFDWHHLDPTTKEYEISKMVGNTTFDKIQTEIDKCVFLCKHCHYIEHERLRKERDNEFTKNK